MIHLKNVNKFFKKAHVLKDLSLDVAQGQCVVLNGVSGSGKSTLLSVIGSLLKVSSGSLEVDAMELKTLNDFRLSDFRKNTVGFVTQNFYLFEMLSVYENILQALLVTNMPEEDISQQIEKVLLQAKIEHKKDAEVSTLSGGEKQRCIIARALVNNPKILLFDEPTANLDKQNTLEFIEIVKMLKNQEKTIIIATHDPFISELDFIDEVIQIKDGKIE